MPTSRLKSKSLQPQPWSAATMTSSIRYVAGLTFFSCLFCWHINKGCLKTLSQPCLPKCVAIHEVLNSTFYIILKPLVWGGRCYFGLLYNPPHVNQIINVKCILLFNCTIVVYCNAAMFVPTTTKADVWHCSDGLPLMSKPLSWQQQHKLISWAESCRTHCYLWLVKPWIANKCRLESVEIFFCQIVLYKKTCIIVQNILIVFFSSICKQDSSIKSLDVQT